MQSSHTSSDPEINNPKTRRPALDSLPYRRSNASLSDLFASTTSLPGSPRVQSPAPSGTVTPPTNAVSTTNGSVFSPAGSTVRSPSPSQSSRPVSRASSEIKDIILRAFSPHVSVLASDDTEELIRHKGIHGGLLELLRPFGEHVPGKVTIRDSAGASRSWEDFAIRFVGVKDGLESPRAPANRNSVDSTSSRNGEKASNKTAALAEYKPARLRTGGDVPQVEELVERHLTFSEEQSGPFHEDYLNFKDQSADPAANADPSPFYLLYLRRLLSGLPLVPSESFSHPIASIIAISSRSPSPIEDLRTLYASSNTGINRLPQWVFNEFLRYYVLIHDEDYDDMNKSMQLYEQMKRHFGLHCHLLRLRSVPATKNSEMDEVVRLGTGMDWMAAAEELAEITRRENLDDDEDQGDEEGARGDVSPYVFETDATNVRAFVREMVTQSLIPSMERASSTWNDSVASRRRGLSGRFMSLSKRWTTFGSTSRNSSVSSLGPGSTGNYDSLQGFYRPDAPESTMRRLADYAMMLRDWKLAHSTYEILCQDFKTDKAWRHFAAANEMAAISALITGPGPTSSKVRVDAIDQYLENAYYSYITRVGAPYYALRSLILAVELLKMRGGSVGLDTAAKWAERILDDRLSGPVGHALLMERIAACYTERKASRVGLEHGGEKKRRAAFWNTLACDAWLHLEKGSRAEACLNQAHRLYGTDTDSVHFPAMQSFLRQLQQSVQITRSGPLHLDGADLLAANEAEVETLQDDSDRLPRRPSLGGVVPSASPMHRPMHRKSLSSNIPALAQLQTPRPSFDPLGVVPASGAYDARPSMERLRPSVPITPGGIAVGTGALPLSPHPEELSPASPSPVSGIQRALSGQLDRRNLRDDGFE